ncbi:MAG: 50S ribosomal protein L35 [Spirochaetota bacterium]|nr:50S ribosomal protein L35 [Spirochaetota bacterium]
MPKIKTNKGAKKRFKLTKSGRIKRANAYKSHLLESKSSNRKRKLRQSSIVAASDEKKIKRMLPYG